MYTCIDVYWLARGDQVVFWPVLRRPGRQRLTRLGFAHPIDAWWYGMAVQSRSERFDVQWKKNLKN